MRAARNRKPGVATEQIAKDFGVYPMTLAKDPRRTELGDRARPGQARAEAIESRGLRRRVGLLKRENPVQRRASAHLSHANLPKKGSSRS